MSWSDEAASVIREVHAALPKDATLAERKRAVDAAYPFGSREQWPYKAWLKARKAYLVQHGYGPALPLEEQLARYQSPMERANPHSGTRRAV